MGGPARRPRLPLGQSVRPVVRAERRQHRAAHRLPGRVRDQHAGLPGPRGRGGHRHRRAVQRRAVGAAEGVPRTGAAREGRDDRDSRADRARHGPVAAAAGAHRVERAVRSGADQLRPVRQPGRAREREHRRAAGGKHERLPGADRAAWRVPPAVGLRGRLRALSAVRQGRHRGRPDRRHRHAGGAGPGRAAVLLAERGAHPGQQPHGERDQRRRRARCPQPRLEQRGDRPGHRTGGRAGPGRQRGRLPGPEQRLRIRRRLLLRGQPEHRRLGVHQLAGVGDLPAGTDRRGRRIPRLRGRVRRGVPGAGRAGPVGALPPRATRAPTPPAPTWAPPTCRSTRPGTAPTSRRPAAPPCRGPDSSPGPPARRP